MSKRVASGFMCLVFLASPVWARRNHTLRMEATAFCENGPTASGTEPHVGTAAADPKTLPMGTRVRVSGAGRYSGEYLIADKGPSVSGNKIDLYVPSKEEAKAFGSKMVKVRIVHTGKGKEDARKQDSR